MNKISIKTQITLWYSLVIFILSAVLFTSFYSSTKKYLISETDRSLLTHAMEIAENPNHQQFPNMLLMTATKQDAGDFVDIVTMVFDKQEPQYRNYKLGNDELRIIAYPLIDGGVISSVLIMGHPVDNYVNALNQLKNNLMLITLLLIIPSILAGYLMAGGALNPIIRLSTRMKDISTENMNDGIMMDTRSSESAILIKSFNELLKRIHTSFIRERQFIADVAHEVKTPLSVIKTGAEVALSKERNADEYIQALSQTIQQTDRLTNRLGSLIDYAWAQSEDVEKQFEKVNLSKLTEEIAETITYMAGSRNIKVECHINKGIKTLGRRDKLLQVFYNLASNAVKFTGNDGSGLIKINLKNTEKHAIFEITDNGMGIEKKDLPNLFSRFYRSDSGEKITGYGLGLAIAYSIIKAHKGKIEVHSEKRKGSTFRVIFNLAR